MRLSSAIVVLAILLSAPRVGAQVPTASDTVATALARVPPGSVLRVRTAPGAVLEGAFRLARDTVFIESHDRWRGVDLGEIRSAWYRQRRMRHGAVAGGLIGGAAGAAFLGFFALLVDATSGEAAGMLAVGGLGGAAAGGLLGGVVGATLPRWTLVYPADGAEMVRAAEPVERADVRGGAGRLGSLEAAVGYGRVGAEEATGGGAGGRLALHAQFGADSPEDGAAPFLTVGPEIGWFDLGGTVRLRRGYPPSDTLEFSRHIEATDAGGVLRGGLAAPVGRAYGLLGIGYHRWDIEQRDERWISRSPDGPVVHAPTHFEHVGYMVGAGMQAVVGRRMSVGVEARRTMVGTFDMDVPGGYWTVAVTAARHW